MANPAQEPPKPTLSWLQPHSRGNVNIWRELLHDMWQKARVMRIMILGAGVQGTLYGVRLARAGHDVTLIARGKRVEELQQRGAVIEDALSARTVRVQLPITGRLTREMHADLCLVAVRREQINEVLPDLMTASAIGRIVFMVNHASGSEQIFKALGRARVVLAFPGAAGSVEGGVDRYIELSEQPTAVEAHARDAISLFRGAGFRVARVEDMDAWLRRHAVFVTIAGALYEAGGDARRLAANAEGGGTFILAVREGWSALDRRGVKSGSSRSTHDLLLGPPSICRRLLATAPWFRARGVLFCSSCATRPEGDGSACS
jgi:2-dehydropantoate 2-reductase